MPRTAAAPSDVLEIPPEIQRRARVRTITEPAYVRYLLIAAGLLSGERHKEE
jgi:hypothetical protein